MKSSARKYNKSRDFVRCIKIDFSIVFYLGLQSGIFNLHPTF